MEKLKKLKKMMTVKVRRQASFKEKVFSIVRKIKKGETLSYKEVARRAGSPRASRAVGAILHTNYDPNIPCHRVIKSDGSLGGYNRGVKNKEKILKEESMVIDA